MRKKPLLAAVAVAVASATALAAPAAADGQLDQAFLKALHDNGISVPSDQ